MTITQVETVQAQMVEFDTDVRYLRLMTPGSGATYNWFRPLGDAEELEFRFVLLPSEQNLKLEEAFRKHLRM